MSYLLQVTGLRLQDQRSSAFCESLIADQLSVKSHVAPSPRTRAVRKRIKMLQSLQKASAKSEVILLKLVECGKLQPGSIDKVCA